MTMGQGMDDEMDRKTLQSLLELGEADSFVVLGEVLLAPLGDIGWGQSIAPVRGGDQHAELLDELQADPELRALPAAPSSPVGWQAEWGELRRHPWGPVLLYLDRAVVLGTRGRCRADGETLILGGEGEGSRVFLQTELRELALFVTSDRIRLLEILRPPSVEAELLARWQPEAPPVLEIPAPTELLAGCCAQPWLTAEATRLAGSPSLVDRFAAVGLLARLFVPNVDPEERVAELAAALDRGGSLPLVRSREYVQALPAPLLRELEASALERVLALEQELERLPEVVAGQAETAGSLGRRLLLARDDLESVATLLRLAGAGELLTEELVALDREAEALVDLFDELGPAFGDEPRLQELAWQQPEAWWGTFVPQ
ncbi:MAG: hypothetical protein RBU45_26645 [Myxococcota bacterium]|jgi:hypothetical protein|nr:hypothetical protein [Myxococcota bacterium]